jgi:hypothetical protein
MRKPDLIIGSRDNPQTLRWHLLKWRGWQLALHKWCRSDDDRALHDHSGHNISFLLFGGYWEVTADATRWRRPFVPYFRRADLPHRIELAYSPIWSLWLRFPPIREWGFHCPKGWRHWKEYLNARDYLAPGSTSEIGPGCD